MEHNITLLTENKIDAGCVNFKNIVRSINLTLVRLEERSLYMEFLFLLNNGCRVQLIKSLQLQS